MFCVNFHRFINLGYSWTEADDLPTRSSPVATQYQGISELLKMSTKRVLITGFGPFPNVDINPSWEGVNAMSRDDIESKYNIRLYQEQIDVAYKTVDGCVPKLWAKLQPDVSTLHLINFISIKSSRRF